ncbi:transposase IS4 family protein [hydrothermal vent metagenome]|uniref:Transposase IS4 family protein n=1 Tax=hydrothermal vent metagenome TaxID=652676 RepID=A0A1W1D3D7_9ZZZZ
MGLRVRKKKNASGSISIHIIDRTNRGYKVVESLGSSKNKNEIESLYNKALQRIDELENNLFHNVKIDNEQIKLEQLFSQITTQDITSQGDELIFGRLFDEMGCYEIFKKNSSKKIRNKDEKNTLFRALVLSRIIYPGSKLELLHYLEYFKQEEITKDKIYRFLDTLYTKEIKDEIEKCIFTHTKKIMNDSITVTFYDVTTLHFESESEDDLRRIGFSKEGKLNRPQIQLGLFTTLQGYPLSFEVYEGNKFEGHTLTDVLKKFQKR